MQDRLFMKGKELRIVYMGTPDFAVAPLKALVEGGYNVVGVVTTPDKPSGRGLRISESAVKKYASAQGMRVFQPERLKDASFVGELRELNADLGIVVAFRMLPEIIWSLPKYGTFNLHASLLPQYRGAAPINWAIINGETETGVTAFFLNNRMDEGAIIDKRKVGILPDDDAAALHDKLMEAGTGLVVDTVERIASGDYTLLSQEQYDHADLKPAPKIFRDTCRVDFSDNGADIVNLVRGLSPYPAAWSELTAGGVEGRKAEPVHVKILKVRFEVAVQDKAFGSVLAEGGKLKVACGGGFVHIEELQPAGKKRMNAAEFINGFRRINDYRFV